jgi:hypothetical protein
VVLVPSGGIERRETELADAFVPLPHLRAGVPVALGACLAGPITSSALQVRRTASVDLANALGMFVVPEDSHSQPMVAVGGVVSLGVFPHTLGMSSAVSANSL